MLTTPRKPTQAGQAPIRTGRNASSARGRSAMCRGIWARAPTRPRAPAPRLIKPPRRPRLLLMIQPQPPVSPQWLLIPSPSRIRSPSPSSRRVPPLRLCPVKVPPSTKWRPDASTDAWPAANVSPSPRRATLGTPCSLARATARTLSECATAIRGGAVWTARSDSAARAPGPQSEWMDGGEGEECMSEPVQSIR
jgi:hypothetical protein